MHVNTICNPPFGATTVVENVDKPLHFDVIIETAKDNKCDVGNWIVELWYGKQDQEHWQAARFQVAGEPKLCVINGDPSKNQKLFTLDLEYVNDGNSALHYTVRFRTEPDGPWYWARDAEGKDDGRLVVRPPANWQPASTVTFDQLFREMGPEVQISPAPSQVTGASIWDVVAPTPVKENTTHEVTIGTPLQLDQFYALVKLSSPWMGPRQGSAPFKIDKDALMMGYVRTDGRHVVILGVAAVENTTTYIRSSQGKVVLKTRNDGSSPETHKAIVATGMDFQVAINAAFYRAREMIELGSEKNGEEEVVNPQWYQSWYDGLAYCTWNGLGREITEERIVNALQDLYNNGIKVSALIVDDNWQSLIDHKWDKFEADSKMFPNGLKGLTTKIRNRFPEIRYIAVWHAMFGYWDGIAPGGWIDKNYKCETVKWHNGSHVRLVSPEDVGRMYDDFYKFLSENGVDAVKTDVECAIDELDKGTDRQRYSRAYQDAFRIASLKHFERRVIYCMAMQPFIFWHSLLPRNAPPALFRNSDDFFPNIPSSHNWHIFCNAMNNLYTGCLNGFPDWDMFQSSLTPYGSLHAAARCISGGPIYVTDSPGQHNVHLTNQMSAISPKGNTVILRPSLVAQPTNPFVRYEGTQLLRVSNFVGGQGGTSLLATFNTTKNVITEAIKLGDFRGILPGEKYVIRGHHYGATTGELVLGDSPVIILTLQSSEWEIFSAIRVVEVQHPMNDKKYRVGSFGLTDKMVGAAAVLNQTVSAQNQRVQVDVTLKALGKLGFYVSDLESRNLEKMLISIDGHVIPFNTVHKDKSNVLTIDLETAWEVMGLTASWSNSVNVTLQLD